MTSRHLALTLAPATDHFPGAVNIEWRKVSSERAELPKDKAILMYLQLDGGAYGGLV